MLVRVRADTDGITHWITFLAASTGAADTREGPLGSDAPRGGQTIAVSQPRWHPSRANHGMERL